MKVFNVGNKPAIELEVSSNVLIKEGATSQISVEVTGSDKDTVKITQYGDTVIVKQPPGSGSSVIMTGSNNVVIGGGANVTQINGVTYVSGGTAYIGDVYVNGRKVSFENESSEPVEPIQITIYCPKGTNLDAKLTCVANLASVVALGECEIDCQGSTQFALTSTTDLVVDASGSAKGKVRDASGDVNLDLAGSVDIDIWGTFDSVKVDAAGMGRICTHGTVSGDYKIDASGMATISHDGEIKGRVKKRMSGMCKVYV